MTNFRVGIIGAAGYTAGELLRLLIHHPNVQVVLAQSESQAGKKVSDVHTDLTGELELEFSETIDSTGLDVVFLCKGHGESVRILQEHPDLLACRVIDLSQDYRLAGNHGFVYGLPEINRAAIQSGSLIANPGCFATSIQLGLLPAITNGFVKGDIHVSGITGSTGAGQGFSLTSHYSWRNDNASVYKPFTHQHLSEIGETFARSGFDFQINFIPYRGAFTRGIITTSYFDSDVPENELLEQYQAFYADHPFTHVTDKNPDLKMVTNTNKALVYPKKTGSKVMVISLIDNLLKGASGQAVQNMNLILGLDESTGLKLKGTAF
ncbi:MAG: N-acetyl-gamma-glutamyl-phosphate reductase [Cyclobacteriaceae bacterium]|nr:N-acetyl-gamma-glutamyl-phosphate reductase [Cyclobacteriaceae bacterium]